MIYLWGLALLALLVAWAPFDAPFQAGEDHPDAIRCLIVLPRPMVGQTRARTEHAQLAVTNWPERGAKIMLTCEAVAEDDDDRK
jgi:hypothetical protein